MEDQISRTNEDSWSKNLAEIRSMLQELVATSKSSPMEFQRFCGDNPKIWISQAERYFDFYGIAENHKLSLASSYLDGAALTWYQWLFENKQLVDWEHFTAKVLICFHKRHLKSPEGHLANLWQVPSVTEYPCRFEAISSGCSEPKIVSPCLEHVHRQRTDISNSSLPRNYVEQSEYPSKTDANKMFDEMLNNYCPKIFTVAPLDDPIEMPDEDAIGPNISEIQLLYRSSQRDMSERYVTTASLDCGSSKQQIEFASFEDMCLAEFFLEPETIEDLYLDNFFMENEDGIPTSELHSDERIFDVKHGKYNEGVECDEGMAIVVSVPQVASLLERYSDCKNCSTIFVDDFKEILRKFTFPIDNISNDRCLSYQCPVNHGENLFVVTFDGSAQDIYVWDSGINSKSMTLTSYTVNVQSLLLLGSSGTFSFITYVNFMIQVWDPGRRWCMHFSNLLSNLPLAVTASLQFNYSYTHLEMNTRNNDWEKNSRGLFVFPSQCMSLTLDAILELRRMTHPATTLASVIHSLWSSTNFPASFTEVGSSSLVHNYWTCYFTKPLTDFFTDALVSATYHDVVGKVHRERIAQVHSCVVAWKTGKITRGQIAFEMVVVFDPGGGTFYEPILEDIDGVLAEISKEITNLFICNVSLSVDNCDLHQLTSTVQWNFSMANPFDGQNREMSNTIVRAQKLKCDVKVKGLILTLKQWLSKHNAYATTYWIIVLFAILRDMYAYGDAKWLTAVELEILVSLATTALTNRDVITRDKSYFILVSGQCGVCRTCTTTMLKHCFDYFGCLRSIEEQSVGHGCLNTDIIFGGVACVIHLGNLESAKGIEVDLSVLRVGNSWFHSNTKAVALDSPSSLDRNTIVMSLWLHSNLEDKVLFEDGSIVVNQDNTIRVYGLDVLNRTDPLDIIGPSKMVESYIWDPGPISYC